MKIIITVMLLLCISFCKAQNRLKDSSGIKFSTWGIGYHDTTATVVTKWEDGRFEIRGDTLAAIKLLWKRLEESEKREAELWRFVAYAVAFTNSVPDYWKTSNNKTWLKYLAELKKLGYRIK